MRSRRAPEASSTLSRKSCCTVRVALSHTVTATSSSAASRAKAASYSSSSSTGTASTAPAPLRNKSRTSPVRLSPAPKAVTASSYRPSRYSVPAVPPSLLAAMATVRLPPRPRTTEDAS